MISLRSFRFQLLTAVNTAIALLLGAFLVVDYRTEIGRRIAEKHAALEAEVDTLLPASRREGDTAGQILEQYAGDRQATDDLTLLAVELAR